jgi:hypothetical protein
MLIPLAELSKGKNTRTAERPAACDFIRGNKSTSLFPRMKSHAALRSETLYVCFYSKAMVCGQSLAGITDSNPAGSMDVCFFECCVLSYRCLCDGPITLPEESCRL